MIDLQFCGVIKKYRAQKIGHFDMDLVQNGQ